MRSNTPRRHSGLGIASLLIGLVSGILNVAIFVIAGVIEVSTPGGIDEQSLTAALLGLGIIGLFAIALVALGLGVGGLFQRDRNPLFAILGIVFSGVTILVTLGVIVLGVIAG